MIIIAKTLKLGLEQQQSQTRRRGDKSSAETNIQRRYKTRSLPQSLQTWNNTEYSGFWEGNNGCFTFCASLFMYATVFSTCLSFSYKQTPRDGIERDSL